MLATAVLAILAMLQAGCAGLPSSSAPRAVNTIDRQPTNVTVPTPEAGRAPQLLLHDFLSASADPAGRHDTARQYLTKEAAARWDDSVSTSIVDSVAVLQDSQANDRTGESMSAFLLRANRVGQLLPQGVYQPDDGPLEVKIVFRKFGGEWRIDQLPPGAIMDQESFKKSYHPHPVYFLNPAGTALVPDQRWIFEDRDKLANDLVYKLADQPRAPLVPAVRNELAGLTPQLSRADNRQGPVGVGLGGVKIDFHGAGALDRHGRELLAAQVIWTLNDARIVGPYLLFADGKPLDDRFQNGWRTNDVMALSPRSEVGADLNPEVVLSVLRSGALLRVDSTGLTNVPGYFGSVASLRTAALSRDRRLVAAVAATVRPAPAPPNQLLIGTYGGGASPVADGTTITRPTWSPDSGSVLAVIDGVRVVRAARDPSTGQAVVADVDSSAVGPLGRQITELRISRDGVRAALIVDGKVCVAVVVVQPNGHYALTSPRVVPIRPGATAESLDWIDGESILVAEKSTVTVDPLVTVQVDGSDISTFTSTNLTAPLIWVNATPKMNYVEDSRTVFQLKNDDPEKDRFWREVPYLGGAPAVPVLPG